MKILIFLLLFSSTVYSQLPSLVIDTSSNTSANQITITTNIQLWMQRYWNPSQNKMVNIYLHTMTKRPKDIFGLPFTVQTKFYPYQNPYLLLSLPNDMIDWVYIELKDNRTGAVFCVPAWLNENGYVMDALDINSRAKITIKASTSYSFKIHTTSFSLLANTNFNLNSSYSQLNWNFKLGDDYIVPNNLGLPSPMIPLAGSDEYGIKIGDTWSLNNPKSISRSEPTGDNFADLADMSKVYNDYIIYQNITNTWFSTDMNQDGKVTLDDYWAIWDESIFFSCSGAGTIL